MSMEKFVLKFKAPNYGQSKRRIRLFVRQGIGYY